MSIVQIYLDAVTNFVITNDEIAYVNCNESYFDKTEMKLSSRLHKLINIGEISIIDHK